MNTSSKKRCETKYCDSCAHNNPHQDIHPVTHKKIGEVCLKGHKPRFYSPKYPYDERYGYKRRCEDFQIGYDVYKLTAIP